MIRSPARRSFWAFRYAARMRLGHLLDCSLVLIAFLAGASLARAQSADTSYSGRALGRLVQKIRADRTLPDSLRRLTAADLVGPINSSSARFFDDSAASEFMHLTAATLHQVPDSLCGKFLQAGADAPDLPAMLAYVDSSSMDRWAIMLERMVRARASSAPGPRVATATEVRAAYAAIPGRLSVEDRQRMIWIARNPPPTRQDACWAMRVIMDGLAQLPRAELGPVVRATFGETPGARPK